MVVWDSEKGNIVYPSAERPTGATILAQSPLRQSKDDKTM